MFLLLMWGSNEAIVASARVAVGNEFLGVLCGLASGPRRSDCATADYGVYMPYGLAPVALERVSPNRNIMHLKSP